MSILEYYKSYRTHLPEYSDWSKDQDTNYIKRLEYIKNNPNRLNQEDIQRGKIILHAIDVIDEYSQSNAEDTEVATDMATGQIVGISQAIGTLAGGALLEIKKVDKYLKRLAGKNEYLQLGMNIIPSLAGLFACTAATFPAIIAGTKLKVGASRRGRFEAMSKDLSNPAIFAVLTPEQQKKVDELSKTVQLDDKDKKRLEKTKSMGLNPLDSVKTLKKMIEGEKEYKEQKAVFDDKIKQNGIRTGTVLSNDCMTNAKRDKQILSDMVRKIDIASQDYAENTELVTNTARTLALGTGGLLGWLSSKLLKTAHLTQNKAANIIAPWFVTLSVPLGMNIYATKIQKQSSRIGRYKIKQEMMNNPASMVYVDEKESNSVKNVNEADYYKKPNIIKFALNLLKDYKEYTNYTKEEAPKELKRHKVIEKLDLTKDQIKEAKKLQMNIFKTFNKVDEKSQAYSENIEAMGTMVQQAVTFVSTLTALGFGIYSAVKVQKNPKLGAERVKKSMIAMLKPFLFAVVPIISVDVITTKMQKKASRVADMLALKEMSDYRNYVDYSQFDSKFLQNKS